MDAEQNPSYWGIAVEQQLSVVDTVADCRIAAEQQPSGETLLERLIGRSQPLQTRRKEGFVVHGCENIQLSLIVTIVILCMRMMVLKRVTRSPSLTPGGRNHSKRDVRKVLWRTAAKTYN